MNLNELLSLGFGILPKTILVFPSGPVAGVWNTTSHQDGKAYGGYEPDNEFTFVCSTSLVPGPRALIGSTVSKEDETWRILRVRTGAAFTTFTLVSTDKA